MQFDEMGTTGIVNANDVEGYCEITGDDKYNAKTETCPAWESLETLTL